MATKTSNGTLVHICLCCGRDTTHRSQICNRCAAAGRPAGHDMHGRRGLMEYQHDPIEDDYSEESDPDSIYHESSDAMSSIDTRTQ